VCVCLCVEFFVWFSNISLLEIYCTTSQDKFEIFTLLGCYTAPIGSYWCFGTTYRSHLRGLSSPRRISSFILLWLLISLFLMFIFCRPSWCQTPLLTCKSLCLLTLTSAIQHSQVLNTIWLCNSLPPYVWHEDLLTTSDLMEHYYVFPLEIGALEVQVGYELEPSFSMPTFHSITINVAIVRQFVLLLWSLHSTHSPNIIGKTSYKQQVFVLPLFSQDCGLVFCHSILFL
jgi:hypothetical protein